MQKLKTNKQKEDNSLTESYIIQYIYSIFTVVTYLTLLSSGLWTISFWRFLTPILPSVWSSVKSAVDYSDSPPNTCWGYSRVQKSICPFPLFPTSVYSAWENTVIGAEFGGKSNCNKISVANGITFFTAEWNPKPKWKLRKLISESRYSPDSTLTKPRPLLWVNPVPLKNLISGTVISYSHYFKNNSMCFISSKSNHLTGLWHLCHLGTFSKYCPQCHHLLSWTIFTSLLCIFSLICQLPFALLPSPFA